MVLGYDCPVHGFHWECDVDELGQRICVEGAETAVTGIVGSTRKSDEDGLTQGNIDWHVGTVGIGDGPDRFFVSAFDVEDAYETARSSGRYNDEKQRISELKPRDWDKRHL